MQLLRVFAGGLALAAAMAAALTWTDCAEANHSWIGGTLSGGIRPLASRDVRLDSEVVQVVVYGGFAEYRADFRFVNDGEARRLRLGFPFASWDEESPIGFRAWQGTRMLRVDVGAGRDPYGGQSDYQVYEADFAHGVTTVAVTYLATPQREYGQTYEYWLHTGAPWKGPIGKAVVRFSLADSCVGSVVVTDPPNSTDYAVRPAHVSSPRPRVLQWVYQSFEPVDTDDVAVTLRRDSAYEFGSLGGSVGTATASGHVRPRRQGYVSEWGRPASRVEEFGPQNAVDGSPFTDWAPRGAGSGGGQWLTITRSAAQSVREVRILGGYHRTLDGYERFGRPRRVRADFSDGTSATLSLRDVPVVQVFPVHAQAKWVRFTLLDAYRGSERDEAHIAEIELGSDAAPRFLPFETLIKEERGQRWGGWSWANDATSPAAGPAAESDRRGCAGVSVLFAVGFLGLGLGMRRSTPA